MRALGLWRVCYMSAWVRGGYCLGWKRVCFGTPWVRGGCVMGLLGLEEGVL